MKKIFLIPIVLIVSISNLFAQPTKAEIEKMMKEAKAEIEKMKKDPEMKELMKNMPDMDSMMKNTKGKMPAGTKSGGSGTDAFSLPERNTKLLNALPIRTFNKAELVSYLHNLNTKLTELIRSNYGKDVTNISGAAATKTGTGAGLWINGEPEKSVLVALKGAELKPDNITLLNNLGGILNSCGLAVNAIPILEYVLVKVPDNNLALNNLGQAYLNLGEDKKAEQYFLRCVRSYDNYPDANLALSYIYNSRGNKPAAIKYAENSLRGAYSVKAYNMLLKLKHVPKMMEYIKHRYKSPDNFNYHKYPILPQSRTESELILLAPQYEAYQKVLAAVLEKYRLLLEGAKESYEKSAMEDATKAMKAWKDPAGPFGSFAGSIAVAIHYEHTDKFMQFKKYEVNYKAEREKLRNSYEAEVKAANYDCTKRNALSNSYLPLLADLAEAYKVETINLYKNYFSDFYYWSSIAAVNEQGARIEFYQTVWRFINILKGLNTNKTYFIYPCNEFKEDSAKVKKSEVEAQPDCFLGPVKVVIPLGVLKLELSCETYKLEAGAGFIGKIEYDRMKGETTLAFGVGASLPAVFYKKAGAEFGIEAEAKSQLYITFDKTGPTDLGVLWEYGMKGVAAYGEAKVEVGLEEEAVTVGFGSGVNMKEGGPLKALIDQTYYVQPDDKQMNKNVPLYKK